MASAGMAHCAARRSGVCGALGEHVEQLEPDAGGQHLRIDEAGADVEQRPRIAVGDRPCQRKGGGPALKGGAGQQAVARGVEAVEPAAARLDRRLCRIGGKPAEPVSTHG